MLKRMREVLPDHDGLGNIVIDEADEDGNVSVYRPCLYYWSQEEMNDYEKQSEGNFGWCVTGANPVWGVYAWMKE